MTLSVNTPPVTPPRDAAGREARRLSTLLEVSQALSGTLNLKSSLHRVLEILARHHGAVRGIVTFLQDSGDRIVDGGSDDADAERDHDGRSGELPSRHSRRPRYHQFESARQAEKAGHRADQHAER